MRILALHASFSSFFSACFRTAVEEQGFEIRLVCSKPSGEALFSDEIYHYSKVLDWQFREDLGISEMRSLIKEFRPDAIITSGWMYSDYLKLCKEYRKEGGLVIAFSDTQFQGRIKQRVGCMIAPWLLHPSIDYVCVPGERQRDYARRLGFGIHQICEPMLCCNWQLFSDFRKPLTTVPRAFIYAGRMLKIKGVDLLVQAYELYRSQVENPWSLKLVGDGPVAAGANNSPGISRSAFVQPSALPQLMREARCFILPSRLEAWGVVLQEAAALGLPLIATEACGAAVHLIRDGVNGFLAQTGSVESIALQMQKIHHKNDSELQEMSEVSHKLSQQFLPSYWARMIASKVRPSSDRKIL